MSTITGPTILLRSGHYFDFTRPEACHVEIEDIAHALAMTCRFGGHGFIFYSVAEHSVLASRIVDPAHAYAALMHDAAEAFVGDIPKPLKNLLPDFQAIERRVEAAIFARFDVPDPLPAAIKDADLAMLAKEQRSLMCSSDDWKMTSGIAPAKIDLEYWEPWQAKAAFLERYKELRP